MKKTIAALAVTALLLTGCGADGANTDITDTTDAWTTIGTDLYEQTVTTTDGTVMRCISYRQYYKGGLDCEVVEK